MKGEVIMRNVNFGFIRAEPMNIFFHSSVVDGAQPKVGDFVEYDAIDCGRKSPQATTVHIVDRPERAAAEALFRH